MRGAETSTALGVAIVGAGHAGGRVAERLRAFGYEDTVTVIGREPYRPYERPPLSKAVLTRPDVVQPAALLTDEDWVTRDIDMILDDACTVIDPTVRCVTLMSGRTIAYDKLVLATGLLPRALPQLEPLGDRVFRLHSYDEALALRERLRPDLRLLMVGAGFIGLEVAASAKGLGANVTVIEQAERPLPRVFDAIMSDWFEELHRQNGVDIRCGRTVVDIDDDGEALHLLLDDGSRIVADLIVSGIGGVPNDGLARDAGLSTGNGVAVSRHCRTSDPHIYAVGDIACISDERGAAPRRLESWKNAEDTAAIAARNICGDEVMLDQVPWFWTDQFGHNIQIAGVLAPGVAIHARGTPRTDGYLAYYVDGETLIGAVGLDCGRDIRKARGAMEKGKPMTAAALEKLGLEPIRDGQPTSEKAIS